jgi:hypothetical protein
MHHKQEHSSVTINRDIQALLEEFNKLVTVKNVTFDPNEAAKNNEAFLELLEQLNQLKSLYEIK